MSKSEYLFLVIGMVNVVAFLLYGIDKQKARKHKWRVPEKTLLLLSVLGGSVGSVVGMLVFHHKTRKLSFWITHALTSLLLFFIVYQCMK